MWFEGAGFFLLLLFLSSQKTAAIKDVVKEYTNGEVTVVWKNALCVHSGNCVRGLPSVFHPKQSPWIKTEGDITEKIIEQIKKCPSGALSYYLNDSGKDPAE